MIRYHGNTLQLPPTSQRENTNRRLSRKYIFTKKQSNKSKNKTIINLLKKSLITSSGRNININIFTVKYIQISFKVKLNKSIVIKIYFKVPAVNDHCYWMIFCDAVCFPSEIIKFYKIHHSYLYQNL